MLRLRMGGIPQGNPDPLDTGFCSPGEKAEVFDAELHAILEGLLNTRHLPPNHLTICVDNQAALTTLTGGNPDNWEFARLALSLMADLGTQGWTFAGLWTPSHCGIPGNDLADSLAKKGTQSQQCKHARATKSWLYAAIQKRQLEDWRSRGAPDPQFPLTPSTTFPEALKKLSPASSRALFQLQTATTPSDPHPSKLPETCVCGSPLSSKHILMECQRFADARMDIFNPKTSGHAIQIGDYRFNDSRATAMLVFMRRVGLGFTQDLRDRTAEDGENEEVQDWDVGGPEVLLLDLRL